MMTPPVRATRTVIIGGGIGGLTLAFRLIQAGIEPASITLLEASDRLGGVIQSTRRDGFLFEHGPDSIIRAKPAGLALWRDLGLEPEFVETLPASRRALIAQGKRLIPVPEGLYLLAPGRLWPLCTSPLLSWRGKLRAGFDLILPRRPADAPEESLRDFVVRRFGRELFERIAQPLVAGIYTADPARLSVAATMPQFLAWEQEHRSLILAARKRNREAASGPRYGLFVSLRDGLHRCIDRLQERVVGVDLRLGAKALALRRDAAAWRIEVAGQAPLIADRIAIAGPAHLAARLLATTAPELSSELAAIPYAGAAILNLVLNRSDLPGLPTAAGFVVPASERRTILAATFMSMKYADRAPDDRLLLRIFLGGATHPGLLELSDQILIDRTLTDLRDLLGLTAKPIEVRIDRWPGSMAQYNLGHRERVSGIRAAETALPGLALIGNGYEGVGIPDIIAQADAVAKRWRTESSRSTV